MIAVGITGQNGFIGQHLYNTLGLYPEHFTRIDFEENAFGNSLKLDDFVAKCDVIVHLAALNRHENQEILYQTNIDLVKKIIESLNKSPKNTHVLFSSSSQEERDNLYGKSKKEGRELLANWALENGTFTGMIVPNVFGPFGKPNYNSFIATFCHKLTHGEIPTIDNDSQVQLIYVDELVAVILNNIRNKVHKTLQVIQPTASIKVSEVLSKLNHFKNLYFENGEIPTLNSDFDLQLFNTFRSYFDMESHYPVKFKQNVDNRGAFTEIIRLGIGGQCSFSTTHQGITRGNHYHTRKIERFAVIKGEALIQLRRIGTDKIVDFCLSGKEPAYVDMPIWYTHNIKNIGSEELFTIFWINEWYNLEDPDTYFETV